MRDNITVTIRNGLYNRYEVLSKDDVLNKLMPVAHYSKSQRTRKQINHEIKTTGVSTARLFLFDNKHNTLCALPINIYDELYEFLDYSLPMNIKLGKSGDNK